MTLSSDNEGGEETGGGRRNLPKGLRHMEKASKRFVVDPVVSAVEAVVDPVVSAMKRISDNNDAEVNKEADSPRADASVTMKGVCLPGDATDDEKVKIAKKIEEEGVVNQGICPNLDLRNNSRSANEYESSVLRQNPPPPATGVSAAKVSSTASYNEIYLIGIGSISTVLANHVWTYTESIRAHQFPLSVVSIFVVAAFLFGYTMGRRSLFGDDDDDPDLLLQDRNGDDKSALEAGVVRRRFRPKPIIRRRVRDSIFGIFRRSNPSENINTGCELKEWEKKFRGGRELAEWEKKLREPLEDGQLMEHLLKSLRPHKKKNALHRLRTGLHSNSAIDSVQDDVSQVTDNGCRSAECGRLEMHETRAKALEDDENYSHIVNPMCQLRGMDLFLSDNPQKEIWRQPLLKKCGLRDVPTLIMNFMMPFGNITAYFTLPDWVAINGGFNNIPIEKDYDPPDVKALKRFLIGDNDYRSARMKLIPCLVDGPLAIKLLNPKPIEVVVDEARHPATWSCVPKSVDPITKKTDQAILELDMDFVSDRTIRRILSIARPHMHRITIDVAFIISKPQNSQIEEPSACLGLWRVDKVDFEGFAVSPIKTIEETMHEIKSIMIKSNMAMPGIEEEKF